LSDIKARGLTPQGRKNPNKRHIYITNDAYIANGEACNTVYGDVTGQDGVGGEPVVLKIDRFHPSFRKSKPWKKDTEYHNPEYDDIDIHSIHSFSSRKRIHPDAIVSYHKVDTRFGLGSEIKETIMNQNEISIVLRESQRFIEDDSTMTKVANAIGQGATNLYTGLRDTGKALFSAPKPTSAPSVFGSTASDAFNAVKNAVSAPSQVKKSLDTTLNKAATVSASTPMTNSVDRMIQAISEGNFDWQELDRLYGNDFRDVSTPKGKEVAQVHPGYSDVADLLVHHGYQPLKNFKARSGKGTALYVHPEGHTVDVGPSNLEWNHYAHGEQWTSAGRGIGDLDDHLRSFHRAW
jgi:hypothetical protein